MRAGIKEARKLYADALALMLFLDQRSGQGWLIEKVVVGVMADEELLKMVGNVGGEPVFMLY